MCDCNNVINEKLKPGGQRLAYAFGIGDGKLTDYPVLISTEKLPDARRAKKTLVIASYCPFCGTKLEQE